MAVKKIEITNVLSFKSIVIDDIADMNCIVGKNNVGKSNLLKSIVFFYKKLEGVKELPPELFSNYDIKGCISVTFDISRMIKIHKANITNPFYSFAVRKLTPTDDLFRSELSTEFTLSLYIKNDQSTYWSTRDNQVLNLISYLYPFFYIEPRHMSLHNWDSLWDLVSRIKSFNLKHVDRKEIHSFFDEHLNQKNKKSYSEYLSFIEDFMSTKNSSHKEKIMSYINAGIKGREFEINNSSLMVQSDGTNSYHYIETYLNILIRISKKEYITPFVFIDEPEVGLHPKMCEKLIQNICDSYNYPEGVGLSVRQPSVFITTHSPNIVKEVILNFDDKQKVISFDLDKNSSKPHTRLHVMNSNYENTTFKNIFSDNESRLFFSKFILFVEGETELELFGNKLLSKYFCNLKDIDIYASSNNNISEKINPSYLNTSIPYLFLFDSDKAWDFKFEANSKPKINFKKNGTLLNFKNDNLLNDLKKLNKGYSKEARDSSKLVSEIIDFGINTPKICKTKQSFKDRATYERFQNNVKKYALMKNCYLISTTIEGVLINKNTKDLFAKWMALDSLISVDVSDIRKRLVNRKYITDDLLFDYMRVIFNGKSEILTDYKLFNIGLYNKWKAENDKLTQQCNCSCNCAKCSLGMSNKYENDKLRKTSYLSKLLMGQLEKKTIKNASLKKTNGWVSRFMDFSIKEIELSSRSKGTDFKDEFKLYFPELHDILTRLQPDS
jgi:predicted ATP-dependent endonuclease of OLD family